MQSLADGQVDSLAGDLYPGKPEPMVISYDPALADRILGIEIPETEQARILRALEFTVTEGEDAWQVGVPSYRRDVDRAIDLVEEVARIYGYDRFPTTLIEEELPPLRRNASLEAEERVRDILVGLGLDEIISYSLIDPDDETRLHPGPDESVALPGDRVVLRNYLSPERSQMRRTLLPGALRTAWSNLRYLERVTVFEIGRIHYKDGAPDASAGETGVAEPRHLSMLMTGTRGAVWWQDMLDQARLAEQGEAMDYFDLKGIIDAFLQRLNLTDRVEWQRGNHASFHPGRCAAVSVGGQALGV